MSANLGRNRRVTPRTSLLRLVALVAVRHYDFFVFLCLVAFTQLYTLPSGRLSHALRVTLTNLCINYGIHDDDFGYMPRGTNEAIHHGIAECAK